MEVSKVENIDYEVLKKSVACGRVIVPRNRSRKGGKLVAVGEGLSTKVNVNVGSSDIY